jgi:acyl-CoA reductase-like NAD-dependent aldehyde dehydrogenase
MSEISIKETGKTAIDSAFGEIFMSCEKIRYIIENGENILKREHRDPGLFMKHKSAYIDYIPCGVIGKDLCSFLF